MLFKHKISQYAQIPPNYSRPRLKRARAIASTEKQKLILLRIPEIPINVNYDAKQNSWMSGREVYKSHIPFNFNGMQVYLSPINGKWLNSDRVRVSSSLEQKIDELLYEAIIRTNFTLQNYTSKESARHVFNKIRNPKKYL